MAEVVDEQAVGAGVQAGLIEAELGLVHGPAVAAEVGQGRAVPPEADVMVDVAQRIVGAAAQVQPQNGLAGGGESLGEVAGEVQARTSWALARTRTSGRIIEPRKRRDMQLMNEHMACHEHS